MSDNQKEWISLKISELKSKLEEGQKLIAKTENNLFVMRQQEAEIFGALKVLEMQQKELFGSDKQVSSSTIEEK